ncbi:MAG TPA: hypothetical protein VGZ47_00115 [Gemmataceae bacterium]|nr:hypothetical protein [Gemmataceae bacterium]
MIIFRCPACGKTFKAGDEAGGKQMRCFNCKTILNIPKRADLIQPQRAELNELPVERNWQTNPPPVKSALANVTADMPGKSKLVKRMFVVTGCLLVGLLAGVFLSMWAGWTNINDLRAVITPDPEKQQFIKIVQENADDPSGLEIISWGDKYDGEWWGTPRVTQRLVKFRCKRIGKTAPSGVMIGGPFGRPVNPGGVPTNVDEAILVYKGDKIVTVALIGMYTHWHAK